MLRSEVTLWRKHQQYIDNVLLGRAGGVQWGKQKHNARTMVNLNHLRGQMDKGIGSRSSHCTERR